jgi:hypothetical protein
MLPCDSVHSTVRHHDSITTQNQVYFLFALVMMRKVRPARRNFHEKEAGQNAAGSNAVAFTIDISHEQAIERRRRMTLHKICRHILDVGM